MGKHSPLYDRYKRSCRVHLECVVCVIDRQVRGYVQQEFDIVNVNKNSGVFALFIEHVNWATILRSDFDLSRLIWVV